MRLLLALATAILLSLSAWPQEAVMDGGSPCVRFTDPTNRNKFTLIKRQELPAHTLLFKANDFSQGGMFTGCKGDLRISAERVQFQPRCSGHPFDELVSSVINLRPGADDPMRLTIAGKKHILFISEQSDQSLFAVPIAARQLLALAFSNFTAADAEFDRLTASLQPPKPQPVVAQEIDAPPKPVEATLSLTTDPADVQVYLDDVFRGSSSGEGKLVIPGIAPGAHKLRLSMIGFKEVSQSLDLASGEKTFASKMDKAGPKPLSQAEIEQALVSGVPKTRLISLVNEYGVDFAISDASEQSLRAKGADDSVLFAIAKNKK